jgi:hypothetical protein
MCFLKVKKNGLFLKVLDNVNFKNCKIGIKNIVGKMKTQKIVAIFLSLAFTLLSKKIRILASKSTCFSQFVKKYIMQKTK